MQASEAGPVIIAYDGSELARAAVRAAASLLAPRSVLVITVWEPGLALMSEAASIPLGAQIPGPDIETATEIDHGMQEHASAIAEQGAEQARAAGLKAEPLAVPDEANVPETIVRIARERDAQAVVVGSRGLPGLKARIMGSTSQGVVHQCHVPVLVVRHEAESEGQA
jgi:nucleotide-binding universal stress UspA family protein